VRGPEQAAPTVAVVVRVVVARGSTPREAGASMVVWRDRAEGTIGGGHLEQSCIEHARSMIPHVRASAERSFTLGGSSDQCCGGAVTVSLVPLDARALAAHVRAQVQARHSRPLMLLFGAGHVGRALAYALAPLPVQVRWIDARAEEFSAPPPAGIQIVHTHDWQAEIDRAPPGSGAVVLTQSHALDALIVQSLLERDDIRYVGLIGSRTKRARFVAAFREMGLSDGQIARLICPIGARGVRDKRPEIIASFVAAEIAEHFIDRV